MSTSWVASSCCDISLDFEYLLMSHFLCLLILRPRNQSVPWRNGRMRNRYYRIRVRPKFNSVVTYVCSVLYFTAMCLLMDDIQLWMSHLFTTSINYTICCTVPSLFFFFFFFFSNSFPFYFRYLRLESTTSTDIETQMKTWLYYKRTLYEVSDHEHDECSVYSRVDINTHPRCG